MLRFLAVISLLVMATLPQAQAQRFSTTEPFPNSSPIISRFQDDVRQGRLDGYLQARVAAPEDWSDYPVLAGFFAAIFQRHPDWIDRLLPARFDAKTADTVALAFRLSGQQPTAAVRTRLAAAGHDARLSSEFAGLPTSLDSLRIVTPTHLDIMWGAFFATGDARYAERILAFFAVTANQSEAVAIDITRMTLALGTGAMADIRQLRSRYNDAALIQMGYAATAQWGLNVNSRHFAVVKQVVTTYIAANAGKPAAKALSAVLSQR
jgi:hypothetical protein